MNYALIYSKVAGDEVLEIFRESTFSTLMNFPMAFSADKLSLWTLIRLYILNLKFTECFNHTDYTCLYQRLPELCAIVIRT